MFREIWQRSHFGKSFVVGMTALALALAAGGVWSVESGHAGSAIPALASPARATGDGAIPASGSFSSVVKQVAPAVVSIQMERTAEVPQMQTPFPFFFGPSPDQQQPQERKEHGLGSGVIVSHDGYILTNHHVVDGAEDVKVFLSDDREFKAKVVGSDAKTDIAVVKIEGADLPVLKLGNSDSVEVGDIVLAVGNPFGIGQTVTMGIVGATSRQFGIMAREQGYEDFIQTDAAINPGNSGGALVNTRGEVVGINTAILSRSGGNNGVGFAVPINLAHHVMTQLIEKGRVVRGYMGVQISDLSPAMADKLGAPDAKGAVVSSVEEGGPAADAGFKQYDIIRKINGKAIRDTRELRLQVANTPPGETIDIAVLRDGNPQDLKITLGEFPGEEKVEAAAPSGEKSVLEGVSVEELRPEIRERLGLGADVGGVVVSQVRPDSPAAEAGLQPGDVIQEVEKKPVTNMASFRKAVEGAGNEAILLLVKTRGGSRFVVVEP
ncbi:MAG: Do family serine endopeptidase [Acidobacteria bacterium]|nr:Do family serine endopeptidase [Acidobacteriota bacterium]